MTAKGHIIRNLAYNLSKAPVVFDFKSRSEFLNGFSKRKAQRRKKGNLINLQKEQKRKRDEQTMFQKHIQNEYQKTIDAVKTNYGENRSEFSVNHNPQVEQATIFYPQGTQSDPFGDVSIQVSTLESPQFTLVNRILVVSNTVDSNREVTVTHTNGEKMKKIPKFARFKQLSKSSRLFAKRKELRKDRDMGNTGSHKRKRGHS
jgi:hypothetical protein